MRGIVAQSNNEGKGEEEKRDGERTLRFVRKKFLMRAVAAGCSGVLARLNLLRVRNGRSDGMGYHAVSKGWMN